MKKILMEDIKINKSFRQTPVREKKIPEKTEPPKEPIKKVEAKDSGFSDYTHNTKRMSLTPRSSDKRPVGGFLKVIFLLSLIIGIIYWVGVFFNSAYVNITAKHQNIEYEAKVFNADRKNSANVVDFEIMIESEKKLKNYILTESKEVSSKATGTIILYNEFSTKSEKLSQGTYISDQDGKTYRLNNTVTIPGYKLDKQKKIPGQVEVSITSFLAGENYNGAPDKFTVNSYKGTTKHSKIYGKLKTELVGGLQGIVYYISEEDKVKIQNIAESSLRDELYNKLKALLPSGYILYPEAIKFSYIIDENILSETAEAKIPIEGKISAILLKEDSLIKNIIRVSLPEADKNEIPEIVIKGIKNLKFNFVTETIIDKSTENFQFALTGNLEAVWNPNKEIIKSKLAGLHKDMVLSVFRENKGITKSMVKIFPPWGKHLPKNPSKINIKIQ